MFNILNRQKTEKKEVILNSLEYEAVLKRISDVSASVVELKQQVLSVSLDMDAFRNKVMRAYQRKRENEEEEKTFRVGSPVKRG